MSLLNLLPDIWRIIGQWLSKRDLIALQLTSTSLLKQLDKINDIWWGKHLEYYYQRWSLNKLKTKKYNNFDSAEIFSKYVITTEQCTWKGHRCGNIVPGCRGIHCSEHGCNNCWFDCPYYFN